MRPLIVVAAACALIASRGAAQAGSGQQEGKSSDPHPAQQERGKDMKGYGYGTQPGKSGTAAKQETGEAREASSAPQDERRESGDAAATAAGSATGEGARSVTGQVVKADRERLSVRGRDRKVHELRLDQRTRVLRDGKEVPVETLQAGEDVRAAFDVRDGRRTATTITLVEKGAEEPPSHTDQARESERRQEGTKPADAAKPGDTR